MFVPTLHKGTLHSAYVAYTSGIPFTAVEFERHTITGEVRLVRFD